MRAVKKSNFRRAFTLVELLCVMAIIGILSSLLLGPVFKAYKRVKNFDLELSADQFPRWIHERLAGFYGELKDFPALTTADLQSLGVLDSSMMKFLQRPGVEFFPFSSKDPDAKLIFRVTVKGKIRHQMFKKDVTQKLDQG